MAKKKVYAVKKGRTTGLFDSWEECRAAVLGYKGAEFKGFSTEDEARSYLGTGQGQPEETEAETAGLPKEAEAETAEQPEEAEAERTGLPEETEEETAGQPEETEAETAGLPGQKADRLIAYVDGSFDQKIGKYAYGCVLLTPEGDTYTESGSGSEPESLAIRNVAGEMLAAMHAVRWALRNGYDAIEIRYDYAGIEKWASGEWRAKNSLTKKYAEYMENQRAAIQIYFQKVKAHSGDYYNDEADRLAKEALMGGTC